MEAPPEPEADISTLLAIEAGWVGETAADGPSVPKGSGLVRRNITEPTLLATLNAQMVVPYAMCYPQGTILYITGNDKLGQEQRIYDLLGLHDPCAPHDSVEEEYTIEYVRLIYQRSLSYGDYNCMIPEEARHGNLKDRMRALADTAKQQDSKSRAWCTAQAVAYINRYSAHVRGTKNFVVTKLVGMREARLSLRIQGERDYVSAYGPATFMGERFNVAAMWLQHEDRRVYEGMVFSLRNSPRMLNLWHGLSIVKACQDADETLALPFYEHVLNGLCNGSDELFTFTIKLIAWYFQRPMVQTGISFVMGSIQGAGKGYLVEDVLGKALGPYYVKMTVDQATGKFNGLNAKCILLYLDEAPGEWNRKTSASIKSLITSPTHAIEFKGRDIQQLESHINVIISTNYAHTCPVEADDRRFFVLQLDGRYALRTPENQAYWARLLAVPLESICKALLTVDLTGFNPRIFPVTAAARQQKELGLCSVATWWLDELRSGEEEQDRLFSRGEGIELAKADVFACYATWATTNDEARKEGSIVKFWMRMKDMLGSLLETERVGSGSGRGADRERMMYMPNKREARAAFSRYVMDDHFFV
jgi:hypothetical protein